MKKILAGLLVALAVLVIALVGMMQFGPITTSTFYKKAEHAVAADAIDTNGKNIYYFYQEDCLHCNNIKPYVVKYYNEVKPDDVNFHLVDAHQSENQAVWDSANAEVENFDEAKAMIGTKPATVGELKILGTPTLMEVDNGVVTQFKVGENEVPTYLLGSDYATQE